MDINYAKQIIAKTADDYDRISDQFDQTRQYNWRDLEPAIRAFFRPEIKVLDIGCGNGRLIESIARYKPDYTGLDLSSQLIAAARKNHPDYNFIEGEMTKLPFADNQYDIVTAIASIHHIPSVELRQQALIEIHRVLVPSGKLIMTNWNLDQEKYAEYINTNHKLDPNLDANDSMIPWKNSQREVLSQRYYHVFTLEEIKKLLTSCDFSIITNVKTNYNLITIAQK